MFPCLPCSSESILSIVGPVAGVHIVAPKYPAGPLCYRILLGLECRLRKKKIEIKGSINVAWAKITATDMNQCSPCDANMATMKMCGQATDYSKYHSSISN